jgi:hypothetical protein
VEITFVDVFLQTGLVFFEDFDVVLELLQPRQMHNVRGFGCRGGGRGRGRADVLLEFFFGELVAAKLSDSVYEAHE